MLVLHRKEGESLVIGDNIYINVLDIVGKDAVKLAIDAPREIPILRSELIEVADTNRESSTYDEKTLLSLKKLVKERDRKPEKNE